jgi:hypothetical protein
MKKMSEEKIEFRFSGIQVMAKNLYPLAVNRPVPILFNFEVKVETRVQPEVGFVVMNVIVTIRDNDYLETVCADFSVWCLFQIIDFDKFIKKTAGGEYLIPELLDKTIKPVSISTVRGIIYSDLRNTYLLNAIMPVIYITDFKNEKKDDVIPGKKVRIAKKK